MELPNYLWGEAVRHSTYLINRAATRVIKSTTPYELFKGRKPNIEHLRVFGCIGYTKIDTQHLKKLDNRSRQLIHLGTEPGSKAYRLFDPTNRRVVVSRDVIFDENKSWDWKNSRKEEETGTFQVGVSQFGNHGINDDTPALYKGEDATETQPTGAINQEE